MKILHTTDLHFNKQWFKWIKVQENKYDAFCISGDFLEDTKVESLSEQIEWVSNWICKFKKPLFTCSGNHDIEEFDNQDWLSQIDTSNYYTDNMTKTIEGVKFGSYPFIGAEGYFEYDDCNVLITHVPPAKTEVSTDKNGNDWGDKQLLDSINNGTISAKVILCGHMHQPKKNIISLKNSTIYNPGVSYKSSIPNHIKIEIDNKPI